MQRLRWIAALSIMGCCGAGFAQIPNSFQQRQAAASEGQGGGFYALYENTILTPAFSRNDAFFNLNGGVGTSPQFTWGMTYSPRIEAGYAARGDGLGIAGRYWHTSAASAIAPLPGDNRAIFATDPDIGVEAADLTASHALRIEQIDGQVSLQRGNVGIIGGVQYLKFHQDYAARSTGVEADAGITVSHVFSGVGPTIGLEGRRPLGGSAFALFASGRASLLFGKRDLRAVDLVGGGSYDRNNPNAMFPTTQVQIGGEYLRSLGARGSLMLRATLEAQYWPSGGAGFRSAGGGDSLADPLTANLGFFGASVGIGVSW